ncbi:MAG: glutamate--tRNA ligase [Alphaproteobacteria bacterium]|nr:glutamate--tRNA ligase [Alphaproteobacteria bacterium]
MSAVKVRFAPSPTGYMHIGNTRTAIFNWLLAQKLGGEFMLRIDDTDKERSKKEYEDAIRESLQWLGLTWNEEARQSARTERYREITEKLMAQGRIYACYETAEELDIMRKKLMAKGQPPIYDRSALKLTADQISTYQAQGRKPHYRFKLNEGDIVWQDMVRGECRYNAANLSDPVIIRADGSYLYHLPSVIDDFDFSITHIVRGEDHVTNTAAQIQMFEAIGGTPPQFAHLPLLTGTEGKLSKRLGSIGVLDLKARGIENMAICSYLAKLGTSEAIEPFYDLKKLAQTLDFSKLGRSQPKFSEEDLARFNTHLVRNMPYENVKSRIDADEKFWDAVRGNLEVVGDYKQWKDICRCTITPVIEDAAFLSLAAELLPSEPWDESTFNTWINEIKNRTNRKGKELFHPLRKAITAADNGPELKILLPLIGYERVHSRLNGQKA